MFGLQNMMGISSMKEFSYHAAMLLLSDDTDAWRTAEPVTKITDTTYPFTETRDRPTTKEVRYIMLI